MREGAEVRALGVARAWETARWLARTTPGYTVKACADGCGLPVVVLKTQIAAPLLPGHHTPVRPTPEDYAALADSLFGGSR